MGKFEKRSIGITGTFSIDFPFYFFGGIFAAALGSFYSTLGERIIFFIYGRGRKQNDPSNVWKFIFTKPSHCRMCNTTLPPTYLIPIFGGIIAKGKCFHCKHSFSKFYPLVELIFSLVFFGNLYFLRNISFAITFTFFMGHLLISMMTDYKKYILDYENIPFLLIFGILCGFFVHGDFPNSISFVVALGFFICFYLLYFFYPKGMGLGDVFYISTYSFLASHPWWILFLNSSYMLALLGSVITKKKSERFLKKKIPMGVYYGFGIGITLLLKAHFVIEFM
jgi:leader peptidase (prepilin peptidase) / N-methyltransferase